MGCLGDLYISFSAPPYIFPISMMAPELAVPRERFSLLFSVKDEE